MLASIIDKDFLDINDVSIEDIKQLDKLSNELQHYFEKTCGAYDTETFIDCFFNGTWNSYRIAPIVAPFKYLEDKFKTYGQLRAIYCDLI